MICDCWSTLEITNCKIGSFVYSSTSFLVLNPNLIVQTASIKIVRAWCILSCTFIDFISWVLNALSVSFVAFKVVFNIKLWNLSTSLFQNCSRNCSWILDHFNSWNDLINHHNSINVNIKIVLTLIIKSNLSFDSLLIIFNHREEL